MESNPILNSEHSNKKVSGTPAKRKGSLRWLVLVLALGAGIYGYLWLRGKPAVDAANASDKGSDNSTPAGPPPSVSAMAARETDMPIYLRGLGSVTAYNTVTVRSQVDGELGKVNFAEGQMVRQGDVLAEVDRRPFEIQLQQGEAQLNQAKGNLARDEGILKSAVTEFDRDQQLLDRGIIPKQQKDLQAATVGTNQGAIAADRAAIDTAQAAIDSARLQITYSRIIAPISGIIGLRFVDPGNVIHATDASGLAVITQVQPIAILFNIPEDNLSAVLKKMQSGVSLQVEAFDRDDKNRIATGKLLTIDNQIDQTTGTSRLKAVFENRDNALYPNQFVNVHLLLDTQKNATVIPTSAIQQGPKGTYVYIVGSDKKVKIRYITVKNTEGTDASTGPELHPGEIVVVDGTDKVQDGGPVDAQLTTGERSGS